MLSVNSFLMVIFLLLRVFFWRTYLDFYIPSPLSLVIGFKLFTEAPPPHEVGEREINLDQVQSRCFSCFLQLSRCKAEVSVGGAAVPRLLAGSSEVCWPPLDCRVWQQPFTICRVLVSSLPYKQLFLLLDQNASVGELNATILTTLGFGSISDPESVTLLLRVATSGTYLFYFIIFLLYLR